MPMMPAGRPFAAIFTPPLIETRYKVRNCPHTSRATRSTSATNNRVNCRALRQATSARHRNIEQLVPSSAANTTPPLPVLAPDLR